MAFGPASCPRCKITRLCGLWVYERELHHKVPTLQSPSKAHHIAVPISTRKMGFDTAKRTIKAAQAATIAAPQSVTNVQQKTVIAKLANQGTPNQFMG